MTEAVRAYFVVKSVKHYAGEMCEVELDPGLKDSVNVDWSKYTPSGIIKLTITNPEATKFFVPGKGVKILFTKDVKE